MGPDAEVETERFALCTAANFTMKKTDSLGNE